MFAFFFDSSALVKRYLSEQGSAWVQGVVNPVAGNEVFVVRITHVEVASALARRRKNGLIDSATADAILARVALDFLGGLAVIEVTQPLIGDAVRLVALHDLRAYDGIQLSACNQLNLQRQALGLIPATFVCSDMALNAVAAANGLTIENPNDHP